MNICLVHDDAGEIISVLSPPRDDVTLDPGQRVQEVDAGDLDPSTVDLEDLRKRYRVDAARGILVPRGHDV
jgi:hypothetical protein